MTHENQISVSTNKAQSEQSHSSVKLLLCVTGLGSCNSLLHYLALYRGRFQILIQTSVLILQVGEPEWAQAVGCIQTCTAGVGGYKLNLDSSCSHHSPNPRPSLADQPLCANLPSDPDPPLTLTHCHHTDAAESFTNTPAGAEPSGGCPPGAEEEGCLAERVTLEVGQEQHLQLRFHTALLCQSVGQQGSS